MSAAATKPTGKKRISSATRKTKSAKQPSIDAHQEEIDGLIRERDEIRSKLNSVCLKIMENANSDSSKQQQQQQPSDVPLEHLLAMIDEIGHYRTAFLSLSEETEDRRNIPLERKITQLSLDEPDLFRKPLTLDQRLTFVARERDLWKENSQLLQIMYASVVDQLERGLFKRPSVKAVDVLRGHRMNLENVCLVFSSLSARSSKSSQTPNSTMKNERCAVKDADKFRPKQVQVDEPVPTHPPADPQETNDRLELPSSAGVKRNVSFADQVHVFDETRVEPERVDHDDHTSHPARASETTIDKMDGNLRMRIIKELSRADHIQRPLSRMSKCRVVRILSFTDLI